MNLTDVLMIAATAISPLIAVQVTRWLADLNEARGRKISVYKTLMATRAYPASPPHVEGLNRIDLEFSFTRPKEKPIVDAWQQYLDHLASPQEDQNAWHIRRVDFLVELLYAMGNYLGYKHLNKTQLKNGIYAPRIHFQTEDEQVRFRVMMLELLEGKRLLPLWVANFPQQENPAAPAASAEPAAQPSPKP